MAPMGVFEQRVNSKKPAEPMAMRVSGHYDSTLQTALDVNRETEMVGAERLELPTYAL